MTGVRRGHELPLATRPPSGNSLGVSDGLVIGVSDGLVKGEKRMRTKRGMRPLTVAGLLAVLGLASGTRAQGEGIPLDRVPKEVMNAAKTKFPGAEIQQASDETEDGKPVYSLEMKHKRHNLDVTFNGDGTVVLVETAVSKKELPKVVLRAVAQKYPGASLRHAGAVRKGPEVKKTADYYQFYLLSADSRPRQLKVDPKGKVLEDPHRRLEQARARRTARRSPGPWPDDSRGY
jgi:hypothetical protein